MDSQPAKKHLPSELSLSKKAILLTDHKEAAFEITLHGRLDYRSEVDLAEAKAMLRETAYEIKSKFNRGAFVSRHSEYALIDEAETEIH